jgi:hypothetical protein
MSSIIIARASSPGNDAGRPAKSGDCTWRSRKSGAGAQASLDRISRAGGFLPHPVVGQAAAARAPPCEGSWGIASPSSASSHATPPWRARGSAQPWYRIARRPERSRGRPMQRRAQAKRKAKAGRLAKTSRHPCQGMCPVYGAPPARPETGAGLTGPVRTNVLGARYSTGAVICAGCASSVTPRTPVPSLGRVWLPVKPVRCIAGNMRPTRPVTEL